MNNISKRALIALFLLINFNVFAVEPDKVPPDTSDNYTCTATTNNTPISPSTKVDGCDVSAAFSIFQATREPGFYRNMSNATYDLNFTFVDYEICTDWVGWNSSCYNDTYQVKLHQAMVISAFSGTSKTCPPNSHPNHTYPQDIDNDGVIDVCLNHNPNLQVCGIGFIKFAIGGSCIPLECGSSGISQSFWGNASVYTGNAGTYCDGGCAYSVDSGQNADNYQGSIALSGVSTGQVCGKGTPGEAFMNDGDQSTCTSQTTAAGNEYLTCTQGNTADPNAPTNTAIDNSENKVGTIVEITPNQESCSPSDVACEVRNLKEQVNNENVELKDFQKELHNKKIAADEKAYTEIVKNLKQLQELNTMGLQTLNTTIINNGSGGSGSSSGGSGSTTSGSGTIDTTGAGLTGDEVGSSVGGLTDTISHDIVNIADTTSQYSGWLPTGTCPASKPMTLTIGGISHTYDMTWQPMCDLFSLLGLLLMATAYISVAVMIQRSI